MANLRLQPPDPFNFRNPDEWTKWKRRYEQFRTASGLKSADETRQVSTLLYCMGEDAEDVLTSTGISDEDRKRYDAVMSKFDGFFKVRKNLIFERARFNQRNQSEGESVEQYITALYHLVETCEYGDLRDEMLRDRLVVGIRDSAMSQKLQMDPELTLEKAMKTVRQSAAVKEQQGQLKQLKEGSKGNPITIEEVRTGRPQTGGGASRRDKSVRYRKGGARGTQPRMQGGAKLGQRKPRCKRCGKDHLPGERCPAKAATCYKCNRKGHFYGGREVQRLTSVIRHPSSVIRHPSSVICHPSSVICHPSSVISFLVGAVMGVACLLASVHVF